MINMAAAFLYRQKKQLPTNKLTAVLYFNMRGR